jgi:hypothetical protein
MGLFGLQRELWFRSVSVSSDEPLCISTLLSLDNTARMTEITDHEERMILLWKMISQKYGGISSRLIFNQEHGLDTPGWRWAPRTFLELSPDSTGDLSLMSGRFIGSVHNPTMPLLGTPLGSGLLVEFPGFMLKPQPRRHGMTLHLWGEGLKPMELFVLLKHQHTGKWLFLTDSYLKGRTEDQVQEYRKMNPRPIHDAIDRGRSALIMSDTFADKSTPDGLIVEVLKEEVAWQSSTGTVPLKVRSRRSVSITQQSSELDRLMDQFEELANQLTMDDTITTLLALSLSKDHSTAEYEDALISIRRRMKEVVQSVWDADAWFAEMTTKTLGITRNNAWWVIAEFFAHTISISDLAEDQTWIVD